MKQCKRIQRACAALIVMAVLVGMLSVSAFAASGGLDLNGILTAVVATNGGKAAVVEDTLEVEALKGDFFSGGELTQFTTMNGNNIVGGNDDPNFIRPWDIRASYGVDSVIKVTAKQDMRLELAENETFDQSGYMSWTAPGAFYYVVESADGNRVTVKEIPVTATMTGDAYGQQVHLAAGDKLYMVTKCLGSEPGNLTQAFASPWFQVETGEYNAQVRNGYYTTPEPPAPTDKTDYLEHPYMVSQAVEANGGIVSSTLVDYQYLTGSFAAGRFNPFTTVTGAGNASQDDDAMGDTNGDYVIWRWQWRCGGGDTMLKMTAKENLKLDLAAWAVNDPQWAMGTSYKFYLVNSEGGLEILKEVEVKETVNVADYAMTVHMAQGDTLYIVYSNSYGEFADGSPATSHYMPVFTMSANGYDAAARPAFNDQLPKTGDETPLLSAAVLMIVSFCACAVVLKKKEQF